MRKQIEQRLQELRNEYEAGQKVLAELGVRQANMQQTLLRINGAIQVLEELIHASEATSPNNGEVAEDTTNKSLRAEVEQAPTR